MTNYYEDMRAENDEKIHAAFHDSQEYFDAYVDYADCFDMSSAYDRAYEAWIAGVEDDEDEYEREIDEAISGAEADEWGASDY